MSIITIGKKEYEVVEELLNQCELLFYEANPRVYSILRANGTTPTQKEIQTKMVSMDHVKQLRLSIEQNGGLIDPLIVVKRNGEYVVLEGNSRLAAYRLLADKDPVKWQKVRANILPEEITENEIFTLLGQYHLVGVRIGVYSSRRHIFIARKWPLALKMTYWRKMWDLPRAR